MTKKRLLAGMLAGLVATTSLSAIAAPKFQYRVPVHAMDAAPALSFSGLSLDNGLTLAAAAGQTVSKSVELRNTGNVPLVGVQLTLDAMTSGLTFVDGCSGLTLDVGASCAGSFQLTSQVAGSHSLKLKAAAAGGLSAEATIQVQTAADEVTAHVASVAATQVSLIADGNSATTLRAVVQDAYGNTLGAGIPVQWASSAGSLSTSASTTDGAGVAQTTLTSSTALATASVTAKAASTAPQSAAVSFIADAASAKVTNISVGTPSVTTGGSSSVFATVTDAYGHALSGVPVYFTTSLGSITSPVTSSGGTVTSSTSSSTAGTATVRAYTTQQGASGGMTSSVAYAPACTEIYTDQAYMTAQYYSGQFPDGVWHGGYLKDIPNGLNLAVDTSGTVVSNGYRYTVANYKGLLHINPAPRVEARWSYMKCAA